MGRDQTSESAGSRRFRRERERRERGRLDHRRPDLQAVGLVVQPIRTFRPRGSGRATAHSACPRRNYAYLRRSADHRGSQRDERRWPGDRRRAGGRELAGFRRDHLDRSQAGVLEGLPAGQRRAQRVRDMGEYRRDSRRLARRPCPRRDRRRARRLPGIHRGSRLEPGDAMNRLIALVAALGVMLTCQRAEAQSWEASAFAGYTPCGRHRPSRARTESARRQRRVHLGSPGRAPVHAPLGRRGALDAAEVGTRRRNPLRRYVRLLLHDGPTAARQRGV